MVIVLSEAISLTKKIMSSGVQCVISNGIIILMDIYFNGSISLSELAGWWWFVCMKMFVIVFSSCLDVHQMLTRVNATCLRGSRRVRVTLRLCCGWHLFVLGWVMRWVSTLRCSCFCLLLLWSLSWETLIAACSSHSLFHPNYIPIIKMLIRAVKGAIKRVIKKGFVPPVYLYEHSDHCWFSFDLYSLHNAQGLIPLSRFNSMSPATNEAALEVKSSDKKKKH